MKDHHPHHLTVTFSAGHCNEPSRYFDVTATKEILAEFLPQVCPWANDSHTLAHLAAFLPVGLHPRHSAHGHELWFDELMTLWDTCYNAQCGITVRYCTVLNYSPHFCPYSTYTFLQN